MRKREGGTGAGFAVVEEEMAEATGGETLAPEDAVSILEEILEAQNHFRFIGLKLKVPQHVIEGIATRFSEQRDHLYYVIVEYLKQVEPQPTWRAIADALKSRVVDLPRLAQKIEEKYCRPICTPVKAQSPVRFIQPHGPADPVTADCNSVPPPTQQQLTVQCHAQKNPAPYELLRGSAAIDQNFAYFTPDFSNSVYRYAFNEDKWQDLPQCPYHNSGLVIIDQELTVVGGRKENCITKELFTLQKSEWVKKYPPMNTACFSPAVVGIPDYWHMNVIVLGGWSSEWTNIVELLNTESGSWSTLTSLPQSLIFPSAALCGDRLYVIGRDDDGFSCSLQLLLPSDQPTRPQPTLRAQTWMPLPHLPVKGSTSTTLREQLVIVGGMERDRSPVRFLYQLVDRQWVQIGSMCSGRYMCLVANPSQNKIVVVGGKGAGDSVEVCVVE